MTSTRRPSPQTVLLLVAMAQQPDRWRHGYQLVAELGLRSGSLYPILIRLAERGLLEASWETELEPGRPPRHRYRLTPAGIELAATLSATSSAGSRSARPARLDAPQLRGV